MRLPRIVRRITDPVLQRVPVPILGGVNRGRWWNLASAGSGYASGRWAREQMELLAGALRPGEVVWDVGAHHGYVTLCAARKVGEAGQVHAFEPSLANRERLQRHLRWNGAANVRVHPYALSSFDGSARFGGESTSKTMALGRGSESVQVRTGATLVRAGECHAPTFLKLDVEGTEAEALEGILAVLPGEARLLIAMHNREADRACTALLEGAGFELIASERLQRARAGSWMGDPDLYAIGPLHPQPERERALLRAQRF